ncbi:MAG TPA: hypothetical protein VGC75_04950 [Candidatus Nitrosocosmicus sp.]
MAKCNTHKFFFDWSCHLCKEEYNDLKGTNKENIGNLDKINLEKEKDIKLKRYKEFDEERAKKLFEEIFLQYLKKGNMSEEESINRSKTIIRKQCELRGIKPWPWV